jgi:tetratricopeptide (TPR) repeat protein
MSGRRALPSNLPAAWFTFALLLLSSSESAAQRHVFVEGLAELTTALAGTYGDEGPAIGAALDAMTRGLAEWDRAIAAFGARVESSARDAGPGAFEMRLTLAGMYVERGRPGDALRELDAAGRLDPRRADLHLLRGFVLDASGRPQEAAEAFRSAWHLDSNDPVKAYYALPHARSSGEGATRDALATLRSAYRRLLGDSKRGKAAPFVRIEPLRDGASGPIVPQAAYVPAYALIARGEYANAIMAFRQALSSDPLFADPAVRSDTLRQGIAALRENRVADARSRLEAAVAETPESSEAHRVLGLVYRVAARDDASIGHLEAAIRANPLNERARVALARVRLDTGRPSEAAQLLRDALEVLPDSALVHWWLGSVHDGLNRVAEARRHFEQAAGAALPTGRADLLAAAGRLARIEGDFEGAAQAFERRMRAVPNDPAVRRQLARIYLEQDRVDQALAEVVAAVLIDPSDAEAHALVGQIDLDAGRHGDAAAALRRALDLNPTLIDARYALASALMRSGRTEEAAAELRLFERAQRQALADRRRVMSEQVQKAAGPQRTESAER